MRTPFHEASTRSRLSIRELPAIQRENSIKADCGLDEFARACKLVDMRLFVLIPRFLLLCFLSLWVASCRAAEPYPNVMPIGVLQGAVGDDEDGKRHKSPLHGETASLRGVVHQTMRWKTRDGDDVFGFFIQNDSADADADPTTSDGIFVYMGRAPRLTDGDQKPVNIRVGDKLVLKGVVEERYGQTELQKATVVARVARDVPLPRPVKLDLPPTRSERGRWLERREGMRVRLPPGAVAVSGTRPHWRMGDMSVRVVGPDHPVLKRDDPATWRLFRPAHPLSVVEETPDGNAHGHSLVLGSLGLASRLKGVETFLPPLHAGARFDGAIIGAVQYAYGEYRLQPVALPDITPAESPAPPSPRPKAACASPPTMWRICTTLSTTPSTDVIFPATTAVPACARRSITFRPVPPNTAPVCAAWRTRSCAK